MAGQSLHPLVYANIVGPTLDLVTSEIRRTPGSVNVLSLLANTAQTITVPAGAEFCMFNSCTSAGTAVAPFFVCDAAVATATVPSGAVTNGTASEFMPSMYNVRLNTVSGISIIAPAACYVMYTFYTGANTVVA